MTQVQSKTSGSNVHHQGSKSEQELSREVIEELISEGKHIVIINGKILKCDAWLPYHPGGELAIKHFVGRDATDEATALHSDETLRLMGRYQIGRYSGKWTDFIPPIQGGVFQSKHKPEPKRSHSGTDFDGGRDRDGVSDLNSIHPLNNNITLPSSPPLSPTLLCTSDEKVTEQLELISGSEFKKRSTFPFPSDEKPSRGWSSPSHVADDDNDDDHGGIQPFYNENLQVNEPNLDQDRTKINLTVSANKKSNLTQIADTNLGPAVHVCGQTRAIDEFMYPAVDGDVQMEIMLKYRALYRHLRNEGLFNCNYWAYFIEGVRYTAMFLASMFLLQKGWYLTSATFLGMFWHQLVFTAHDAGHMGITHDYQTDTVIGIVVADFLGGLSLGWWKRSHNVHHIVTNSIQHDPDIQLFPFFAFSGQFLKSFWSSFYNRLMEYDIFTQFFVQHQHYLYYILLLFGRFNLYRLSWVHLIFALSPRKGKAKWHRHLEIAGHFFFWYWFGYLILYKSIPTFCCRVGFVMISHMVTAPLHVQITLSHFAMSTKDVGMGESFAQRMLRTTMDVDCPPWLDFFHGGLQFQAIHHLFPRIPRHNLRKAQPAVMKFCDDVGIPYAMFGFVDGNKAVIGRLALVARQAVILNHCRKVVASRIVGEDDRQNKDGST